MYYDFEDLLYKDVRQLKGSYAHKSIDVGYSEKTRIVSGISVCSEKYGVAGKIDKYFSEKEELVECKRMVKEIYVGYVYQLYAQYYAMVECGYKVRRLSLYSMATNTRYRVVLPSEAQEARQGFLKTLDDMRGFDLSAFIPTGDAKCANCIYSRICKWGGDDD